jgi:hypothetical protein
MVIHLKSYVKIYGPPIVKAIRTLEKIAAESSEVIIASYFDTITPGPFSSEEDLDEYISTLDFDIPIDRRSKIISKSGYTLGEYDFFFEWARDPTWEEIEELISKIDEALSPLGCNYTIVTR